MRNSIKLTSLIVAALVLSSSTVTFAEEKRNGNQPSNQQFEQKWGTPSRSIINDDDQRQFDSEQGGISGVSVIGAEVFSARGFAAPKPAQRSALLLRHTGIVLNDLHIYPVFWGSFTADYKAGVMALLTGMACAPTTCTQLSSQIEQYWPVSSKTSISIGTTFTDISVVPTGAPTTATILSETAKVVSAANSSIDPKGLYMVFTDKYPQGASYCAWHGAGSVKIGASTSPSFTIAYMPNLTGVTGCSASYLQGYSAVNNYSAGIQAVANVSTHEIYEAMTDPFLNAWYDSARLENGDKCAWNTGMVLNAGASNFYVQQEWSNLANSGKGACATS
jgi:hypothetical protein